MPCRSRHIAKLCPWEPSCPCLPKIHDLAAVPLPVSFVQNIQPVSQRELPASTQVGLWLLRLLWLGCHCRLAHRSRCRLGSKRRAACRLGHHLRLAPSLGGNGNSYLGAISYRWRVRALVYWRGLPLGCHREVHASRRLVSVFGSLWCIRNCCRRRAGLDQTFLYTDKQTHTHTRARARARARTHTAM